METYTLTSDQKLVNAKRKVKNMKGFYTHATVYIFVNLFIIISCYLDSPESLLTSDPYMTAVFWGIGLAAHGFSVFGRNLILGQSWEVKEIQKILQR